MHMWATSTQRVSMPFEGSSHSKSAFLAPPPEAYFQNFQLSYDPSGRNDTMSPKKVAHACSQYTRCHTHTRTRRHHQKTRFAHSLSHSFFITSDGLVSPTHSHTHIYRRRPSRVYHTTRTHMYATPRSLPTPQELEHQQAPTVPCLFGYSCIRTDGGSDLPSLVMKKEKEKPQCTAVW